MARTALSFAFFSLFLLFSLLSPDRKAGDSTPLPSFFSRETGEGEEEEEEEEKPFIAFPTATIAPLPLFLSLSHRRPRSFIFHSQTLLGELGIQAKRFGVIVCSRCSQLSRSH